MKNVIIFLLVFAGLFINACSEQEAVNKPLQNSEVSEENPSDSKNTFKPPAKIDNINREEVERVRVRPQDEGYFGNTETTDPNYGMYKVPDTWEINWENPNIARSRVDFGFIYNELDFSYSGENTPEKVRDWRLTTLECTYFGERDTQTGCEKGFKKAKYDVDGIEVYALHYYGALFDPDIPTTDIFWTNQQGEIVTFNIIGDFFKAQEAWESIVKTYRYPDKYFSVRPLD